MHPADTGPLDRERELERLDRALDRVAAGTGATIVVEGEAGIGKSTILRCARDAAADRGFSVLHARGTELETDFAFGVIRRGVEPALRAAVAAGTDPNDLFSGAAALAGPVLTDAPQPATDVTFGVFHGLYWLLATLAERGPLLLAIDDAQWADEASLRLLAYLHARIESLPLALLAATRPIDQDDSRAGVLTALLADPDSEVLTPGALSEQAVSLLLGGSPDPRFSRACHQTTGGNPFLLTELLQALREDGVPFTAESVGRVGTVAPPQVARSVRARLGRLEPAAGALARAVATLGDDAPLELACRLARLSLAESEPAVGALTQAGLLEGGRLLRFRHPLLRAAVASSISSLETERGHRTAAGLLRERGGPPEQIALHLVHARPTGDPSDVETLREAADRVTARGAPSGAIPPLRRALDEPLAVEDRIEVLLALARAERAGGTTTAAREHLHEAVRIAPDPVLRARALVELARATGPEPDRIDVLIPLLEGALTDAGALDRELRLRLQAAFLFASTFGGRGHDHRTAEIAEELARLPGDTPAESIALSALVVPELATDGAALGSLSERVARNADELLSAGALDGRAHSLMVALRWTDRLDVAERLTERWLETARRQGSAESFAAASVNRSNLNRMLGRLRQGEEDAEAAIAALPPGEFGAAMARVALADCLLKQGELDAAQDAYDSLGFPEQVPPPRPFLGVLDIRAQLRAARGDNKLALADFRELIRRNGGHHNGGVLPTWLTAVECEHRLGNYDAVRDELARALTTAREWGTESAIGSVLRTRGRLAADTSRAIDALRAAVQHLERSPRRLELAGALVDLGAVLRRAGWRTDSREPLRSGYEMARDCGADGLAEYARRELAASGTRLRRERLTGIESLTASERRIAELAASGASNADIAQSLFVTVKTVEMHLTHAYRKLDISGRTELERALPTDRRHD